MNEAKQNEKKKKKTKKKEKKNKTRRMMYVKQENVLIVIYNKRLLSRHSQLSFSLHLSKRKPSTRNENTCFNIANISPVSLLS